MRGRILRAIAVVAASQVAVNAIGFSKRLLAAFYFGTSGAMDAYLVALLLPDIAMSLMRTGLFNFIPLFAAERARLEEDAWDAAGKMLTCGRSITEILSLHR